MTDAAPSLLYFVFALGGAAMYFLLPRRDQSRAIVGGALGLGAVVALFVVLTATSAAPNSTSGYFCLFAAIAIAAASRVVTHAKPVYSAVYFVLLVVAVAALLILLSAEFLAAALVIIYGGAILVTYLFVIMLANQGGATVFDSRAREPFMAVLAGFVLMAAIATRAGDFTPPPAPQTVTQLVADGSQTNNDTESNTLAIGMAVMTRYVVALEIAGVLLLIAMVGAIALTKKRVPKEYLDTSNQPSKDVGKEVAPY